MRDDRYSTHPVAACCVWEGCVLVYRWSHGKGTKGSWCVQVICPAACVATRSRAKDVSYPPGEDCQLRTPIQKEHVLGGEALVVADLRVRAGTRQGAF